MQLATYQAWRSAINKPCQWQQAPPLQSVTGTLLDVVGSTDIYIDGMQSPINVIIVRNLQEQLILGCNVLANTIIDLSRGIVRIQGKTWPIMRPHKRDYRIDVILPATGNTRFNKLIRDNEDLFSKASKSLGQCIYTPMSIETEGKPIAQRSYRAPLLRRQLISDCVDDMLHQGIIRPSMSSWSSPVTIVPKADGTPRFCVDYRKLNAITPPDNYPLPFISSILDDIGQSKCFSTLDLKSGYWQIAIDEKSIPKTAFRCHKGLFEFLRLPFGLRNAPAAFQRIMDTVLGDLIGPVCRVNLDDVVIYSKTEAEHLRHIAMVFDRLRTAGLTLNAAKCHFGVPEIKLLGFIINEDGVSPDPAKVEVIQNLPPPTSVKQIRSFIGSCSFFRKFLPNFSHEAEALLKLTRKHVKFVWGPAQQKAFMTLKALLISSKVMMIPRPDRPYILYTDASDYAVGAILVQKDDSGMERVIQYVSQALSTSQRKWSVTEKECWAIVFSLDKLKPYLYGAQFVINTDHKALKSLFIKQMNNTRIQRWAILLAECNAEIKYLPGKYNGRADMCSRIPVPKYINVIDTSENWVDPLAFPEQRIEETLPLIHDGLNLVEIALQQKVEFAKEFRLAAEPSSDFQLINDVLNSVKRPYKYADDFPRLLLPAKFRPAVIDRAHREVGHLSHATVTRVAEAPECKGPSSKICYMLCT